jgi:environmental stress-induced protein Ves
MSIQHQVIKANKFQTTRWSGGTTTELFIYPANANYIERNFDFRISTATVEVEESTFTELLGYARKLMVLDGETTLTHENKYTKTLSKFLVDEFEGGCKTTSKGCCTDFNVMTRAPFRSELKGMRVEAESEISISPKPNSRWLFLYVYLGSMSISGLNLKSELNQGDFLVLENPRSATLKLSATTQSEVVVVEISASVKLYPSRLWPTP